MCILGVSMTLAEGAWTTVRLRVACFLARSRGLCPPQARPFLPGLTMGSPVDLCPQLAPGTSGSWGCGAHALLPESPGGLGLVSYAVPSRALEQGLGGFLASLTPGGSAARASSGLGSVLRGVSIGESSEAE